MKAKNQIATKALAYCALLAALSVVLARLFGLMPEASSRYSIEAIPIFLAGMLFGPLPGAMVGFTADFVGCLFSPFGYNPIFCIPPILYGVFGGIFRHWLGRKSSLLRLAVSYLFPVVLGSILYQSCTLSYMYYDGSFLKGLMFYLSTRSVQFAFVFVADVLLSYLLLRSGIFTRMGIWPPAKRNKERLTMTAEEAVAYIHSITWMGSRPGLERTQELLRRIGDPQKQLKFIHIAGTNGKGSTAAMTASILQQAGYRVGLFTSPCIFKFNERIQINGVHISDEDLAAVTSFVKPLAAAMPDHPTEFELVSCIGFEYFKRKNCDIVVLEVGMGGALDSTNVIDVPEVAVITNIGLDHTDFLGKTLAEISETKAGIFKEGGSAVIYPGDPEVIQVLERICAQRGISPRIADFSQLHSVSHSLQGQYFDCADRKNLFLPLLGVHQMKNAAVVLGIIDTLTEKGWKISEENIREGLARVSWPGRFDIVRTDPLFIIDGGHNPQCIEALVHNIRDYLADRRVVVLTGVLADKDYARMFRPVMGLVEQFVCITPPSPRKLEAVDLAAHLQEAGCTATACDTINEGVKKAIELAGTDGMVLCFGSLYSIADIRAGLDALQ